MSPGEIIRMRNYERVWANGETVVTMKYKARKGAVAVFLFLGYEPMASDSGRAKALPGVPLNPEQVLIDLGWTPPPEPEADAEERR